MGLFGFIGDLGAGLIGSAGSSKATDTTVNNLGKGIAIQSGTYNQTRSDFSPWQSAGGNAMTALADALGVSRPTSFPGGSGYVSDVYGMSGAPGAASSGGYTLNGQPVSPEQYAQWQEAAKQPGLAGMHAKSMLANVQGTAPTAGGSPSGTQPGMTPNTGFQASPGYKWAFDQGVKAVDAGAATKGLIGSGARLKGLMEFGQGLGNQEYYNYLNQLTGMARMGAAATERVSDAGMHTADKATDYYKRIGEAKANNAKTQANVWGDVISNAGAEYEEPLSKLFKLSW